VQKCLIASAVVVGLALFSAAVYSYERYHRGPSEAALFGTWQQSHPYADLYRFNPDHTYQIIFSSEAASGSQEVIWEQGTWYAGGDFIYLRIPWDHATDGALRVWCIESLSPNELRVRVGPDDVRTYKRVEPAAQHASNQTMQPTAGRRTTLLSMTRTYSFQAKLNHASGG
jgi:hypothetical protein